MIDTLLSVWRNVGVVPAPHDDSSAGGVGGGGLTSEVTGPWHISLDYRSTLSAVAKPQGSFLVVVASGIHLAN